MRFFAREQIEYLAPFLQRWGGKVFLYAFSHGCPFARTVFERIPGVECLDFSVENIVHAALHETKKIVFLTGASLAYEFGRVQRKAMLGLQRMLPGRVLDFATVGHCMYGCPSCSAADHRIPIAYASFMRSQLPYTADDIRRLYIKPNCRNVLVAPTVDPVSMTFSPTLLQTFVDIQATGRYNFVWKLHPASLAMKDLSVQEKDQVKFLQAHFTVTPLDHYALFPFLQVFDTVIVDLESSAGFSVLYFGPKVLIAYHGPTDYNGWDPDYLSNLTIFRRPSELRKLLLDGDLPPAKANRRFFVQMYGEPNGNEDVKFAIEHRRWHELLRTAPALVPEPRPEAEILAAVRREWQEMVDSAGSPDDRQETESALGYITVPTECTDLLNPAMDCYGTHLTD